jgi:hypothetical protein
LKLHFFIGFCTVFGYIFSMMGHEISKVSTSGIAISETTIQIGGPEYGIDTYYVGGYRFPVRREIRGKSCGISPGEFDTVWVIAKEPVTQAVLLGLTNAWKNKEDGIERMVGDLKEEPKKGRGVVVAKGWEFWNLGKCESALITKIWAPCMAPDVAGAVIDVFVEKHGLSLSKNVRVKCMALGGGLLARDLEVSANAIGL